MDNVNYILLCILCISSVLPIYILRSFIVSGRLCNCDRTKRSVNVIILSLLIQITTLPILSLLSDQSIKHFMLYMGIIFLQNVFVIIILPFILILNDIFSNGADYYRREKIITNIIFMSYILFIGVSFFILVYNYSYISNI